MTALITRVEWRTLFLRVLRNKATIRAAAEQVGLTTSEVRKLMRADPDFAVLVNDALQDAAELLEESVYQRALAGDNLMSIFVLKGLKPEKYRDNYRQDGLNGATINVKTYVGWNPDDWDKKIGVLPAQQDILELKVVSDSNGISPDLGIPSATLADTTAT